MSCEGLLARKFCQYKFRKDVNYEKEQMKFGSFDQIYQNLFTASQSIISKSNSDEGVID